jgi:hypothetical protein
LIPWSRISFLYGNAGRVVNGKWAQYSEFVNGTLEAAIRTAVLSGMLEAAIRTAVHHL